MLTNPDSIWVQVLKGKYLRRKSLWQAGDENGASWVRNSIMKGKFFSYSSMCFQVGSGRKISIWQDPWILALPNFKPLPLDHNVACEEGRVPDLLMTEERRWDVQEIQRLL